MAEAGIDPIVRHADITVLIPYQRLLTARPPSITMSEAFGAADEMLGCAVRGMVEFIRCGEGALLDGDFEFVRPMLEKSGLAFFGMGAGATFSAALADAAAHPLLGADTLKRARKIILNLTVTEETSLGEFNRALDSFQELLHEDVDLLSHGGMAADVATATLYATALSERAGSGA